MLVDDIEEQIRKNLTDISEGKRVEFFTIGYFTTEQFSQINEYRKSNGLPELLSNEIIYLGRHHYESRCKRDGYSIEDLIIQITSSLSATSTVEINKKGSCLVSSMSRDDGYGNEVTDVAIFEFTAHKPRAELFCVVPKGDVKKPPKK